MPKSYILDEAPVDLCASDPSAPGCGVCVSMIWCSRIGDEDDYENKWEVLRNV
jgi:hypothetical protein